MLFNRIINKYRYYKILKSLCSVGNNFKVFGIPVLINPKNIIIGNDVNINNGAVINATESEIRIGNMVTISSNAMILSASYDVECFLYNENERRKHRFSKIVIGNNVWICAGAIILPNVTVADHVIIGAGSVVTHSINENYVVVAGNPAKIVKHI